MFAFRYSDSALRCSTNEPPRFHGDRGLLRIWRRNITEIKLRSSDGTKLTCLVFRPWDSALQCSINELQRFHRDWGLLRVWRRNITEIKLRSKRFCHIPRRSRSHLPNNHAQQLQAYSDHSASWWTDITTKRTRGTASWFPMSIEISF